MFRWFRKTSQKPVRLMPESKWRLECTDVLRVTDDHGDVKEISKDELASIIVETNDTGPWGADVWWLLFGPNDQMAMAYPQGATGEDAMLSYFTSLPGFDHAKLIEAMGSTQNAVFPVWRRAQ
ncbi:MAG: hypothetical protein JSS00_10415 [Proteobacteria bacterium]|nr:hypothetical protein [Pseudomonadota bacterium]